ncbi:hypothetical protein SVAN01_02847 [Stagonosporopsis vannaccii]|nr:hypothetical protein SVAN01_02847 [Stagonosporopsis vannaccii]
MRSIECVVHIEGRSASHTTADYFAHGQQPHNSISSSLPPLPKIRIQQATISTSQQFTIATNAMETGHPTMPATITESAAPSQEKHGLSSSSIAGLAMIPVAMLLLMIAIFTYFWLRKRGRRIPIIRHVESRPPAVPEKDFDSPASSFESTIGGGRVRNMAAMSTPIAQTDWVASSRPRVQASSDSAVHHNPWSEQLPKTSADITTAGLHVPRETFDAGSDSPIDRSSPFRLKRGDTRKRSSLDPDVMSAWPAPPEPAARAAPLQWSRTEKTYMERRSISAEYFAQEKDSYHENGAQNCWEKVRLGLGPDPGPTFRSH